MTFFFVVSLGINLIVLIKFIANEIKDYKYSSISLTEWQKVLDRVLDNPDSWVHLENNGKNYNSSNTTVIGFTGDEYKFICEVYQREYFPYFSIYKKTNGNKWANVKFEVIKNSNLIQKLENVAYCKNKCIESIVEVDIKEKL